MKLGPADQARLGQILKLARDLEETWPATTDSLERHQLRNLGDDVRYQNLQRLIADSATADAESLRRLAGQVTHLQTQVSLAHFYACLVPFERLSGRALRDDEFLVEEGDRPDKALAPVPLKLVIENVRSAFNVGALFRTSECLGVAEILICGYTPDPNDEKTARTSMGTSASVPWRRLDRGLTACAALRAEGYTVVALETSANAVSLHDCQFTGGPLAFVVGNERFGIEGDTLQTVDAICRIPVRGVKNSMNVGVAFGIAAFEWLRQFERSKSQETSHRVTAPDGVAR